MKTPSSLLLDPHLTPAAKLLWMVLQLHSASPLGPSRLAALSGLARVTVLRALPALMEVGWCTIAPGTRASARDGSGLEARVSIPKDLLTDQRVGIRGKLLYGILQLTPQFRTLSGHFTHAKLSQLAGASINTIKLALRNLTETGWLRISQKNRLAPLAFTLLNPVVTRGRAEVAQAQRRLDKARYRGEALMREVLSLLIDSDQFRDNHSPSFLYNPWTLEFLELDRFYPAGVAFEFNGPQHYRTTKRYPSKATAAMQWTRDGLKLGLCLKEGVHLVTVHAEDLSLEGMRKKIGNLLPMRDLARHGALAAHLEKRCAAYRNAAETKPEWARA